MDDPSVKYELMYRRPGEEQHELLTDVLDDIIIRLQSLEEKLNGSNVHEAGRDVCPPDTEEDLPRREQEH